MRENNCPLDVRTDEPKGDKPWTCPKCIDAAGEILNLIESNSELSRQLQAERTRRLQLESKFRELYTVYAGSYLQMAEELVKFVNADLIPRDAQDSADTRDEGADLSADHPESSE